jgi:hypothetical protein
MSWRLFLRDVQATRRTPDDMCVIDAIEESWLVAQGRRIGAAFRRMRPYAASARTFTTAARRFGALPLDGRIRFVATMLLTAIIVHVAVTKFQAPSPNLTARLTWVAIAAVLSIVAIGSRAVAAAWIHRKGTRA